jgi:hypothetical protein
VKEEYEGRRFTKEGGSFYRDFYFGGTLGFVGRRVEFCSRED